MTVEKVLGESGEVRDILGRGEEDGAIRGILRAREGNTKEME